MWPTSVNSPASNTGTHNLLTTTSTYWSSTGRDGSPPTHLHYKSCLNPPLHASSKPMRGWPKASATILLSDSPVHKSVPYSPSYPQKFLANTNPSRPRQPIQLPNHDS